MIDSFHWSDAVGLTGTSLILLTFFLLQTGKMASEHLWYSVLNGLGALLIIVSLMVNFNLSSFVIEVFWILFSIIGVIRYFKDHSAKPSS